LQKRWITAEANVEAAASPVDAGGLPFPFLRLMAARGWHDAAAVNTFCDPRLADLGDPYDLAGVREGAERLLDALAAGRRICVFGDYDVDGITASALMFHVLRQAGGEVSVFIPSRMEEGYGLSLDAAQRCLEERAPELLITVDCGTNSGESVAWLRGRGVEVMVTDHHTPGEVAQADVVINPKCGSEDGVRMLAGVGVAFKLCHGLVKRARERGVEGVGQIDLRPLLSLVALGTVCDIVPLLDENRILTRHGMHWLARSGLPGITSLLQVARVDVSALSAYHVGFQLGPRLNAAGRLADASAALELLTSDDAERTEELAELLDAHNRERQQVEAETVKEAMAMIDARFEPMRDYGLVVAHGGWHPGVVGIVASRLARHYRRPVAVIALDEATETGRGSCRSVEDFDMVEGLNACARHLVKYGGHAMAAGLEIEAGHLEAFTRAFNEVARAKLDGEDLRERVVVDAWVELPDLTRELFDAVERLRPFGVGNPRPIWAVAGVEVALKQLVGGKHCRLTVTDGTNRMSGIFFGCIPDDVPEGRVDVAFALQLNRFRGEETLEMQVKDVRCVGVS
jgi:single-stranded-DNA-specific exonuclease